MSVATRSSAKSGFHVLRGVALLKANTSQRVRELSAPFPRPSGRGSIEGITHEQDHHLRASRRRAEKVLVEGQLRSDEWEKDGKKQTLWKIVARTVEFLGRPQGKS
jgi:hypothetical protein